MDQIKKKNEVFNPFLYKKKKEAETFNSKLFFKTIDRLMERYGMSYDEVMSLPIPVFFVLKNSAESNVEDDFKKIKRK